MYSDSYNPDLQALEYNLSRILWQRELGKAATLVSNLWTHQNPQSISISSKYKVQHVSPCGTSSQLDSEDLLDDCKTSSEWKLKGHIYFEAGCWPAGKIYEDAIQAAVDCSCSCPSKGNFLQFCGRTRLGIVDTAATRLCTGQIGEPTPVEKMHRRSCVGVGKSKPLLSAGEWKGPAAYFQSSPGKFQFQANSRGFELLWLWMLPFKRIDLLCEWNHLEQES